MRISGNVCVYRMFRFSNSISLCSYFVSYFIEIESKLCIFILLCCAKFQWIWENGRIESYHVFYGEAVKKEKRVESSDSDGINSKQSTDFLAGIIQVFAIVNVVYDKLSRSHSFKCCDKFDSKITEFVTLIHPVNIRCWNKCRWRPAELSTLALTSLRFTFIHGKLLW